MKKIVIPVDIYNEFCYNNTMFQIDRTLKQYKVMNKPSKDASGKYNDWTNESIMDSIVVHEFSKYNFKFYDQDGNDISAYIYELKQE